jgi:hypothetical protein
VRTRGRCLRVGRTATAHCHTPFTPARFSMFWCEKLQPNHPLSTGRALGGAGWGSRWSPAQARPTGSDQRRSYDATAAGWFPPSQSVPHHTHGDNSPPEAGCQLRVSLRTASLRSTTFATALSLTAWCSRREPSLPHWVTDSRLIASDDSMRTAQTSSSVTSNPEPPGTPIARHRGRLAIAGLGCQIANRYRPSNSRIPAAIASKPITRPLCAKVI